MSSCTDVEIRRHALTNPWTYTALDERQRAIRAELEARPERAGVMLFSEVSPVITLGRRDCPEDFILPQAQIERAGVELLRTTRGGRATYHGPGQWVVFVVDRLERLTGDPRGVRKAVEAMLAASLDVARGYLPEAELRDGADTGVWDGPGVAGKKLVSLGIKVDGGILQHGLCFNGFQTPQSFLGIRPCGLDAQAGFLLPDADEAGFLGLRSRIQAALERRLWTE